MQCNKFCLLHYSGGNIRFGVCMSHGSVKVSFPAQGINQETKDGGMYAVNSVLVTAVSADLDAEKGTRVVQPLSIK